jgi:hypothetical protein
MRQRVLRSARICALAVVILAANALRASADPLGYEFSFTFLGAGLTGTNVSGKFFYDPSTVLFGTAPDTVHPVTDLYLKVGDHEFTLADAFALPLYYGSPGSSGWGVQYSVRAAPSTALFGNVTQIDLFPGGNLFFGFRTTSGFFNYQQAPLTAVPEPAQVIALAVAGGLLLTRRLLRKRSN